MPHPPQGYYQIHAPLHRREGFDELVRAVTAIFGFRDTCDFNVNDYANHQLGVQAAVTYVNLLGGGIAQGEPGAYGFTPANLFTVLENVHLIFPGYGSAVITYTGAEVAGYRFLIESNTKLQGVKIDFDDRCGGMSISAEENVIITECWIIDTDTALGLYHCIRTLGTSGSPARNILIEKCKLSGAGDDAVGMDGRYSYDIYVLNNDIGLNEDSGIEADDGAHDILIDGNTVRSGIESIDVHSHVGPPLNAKCKNIIIVNNHADGLVVTQIGGWTGRHEDVIVENNVVEGQFVFTSVNGGVIKGNAFKRSTTSGANIDGCVTVVFSGNTIKYAATVGVKVKSTTNIEVLNNKVICSSLGATYDYGIDLELSVVNFHVKNNTIWDDTTTTSLLTADAAAGQTTVTVANALYFEEGQPVTISDATPLTENNFIDEIRGFDTLIMVNNLANTYTVVQNAVVTARSTTPYGIRTTATCSVGQVVGNFVLAGYSNPLNLAGTSIWCADNLLNYKGAIVADTVDLPSVPFQFTGLLGTAAIDDTPPTGIEVNAVDEGGLYHGWIPHHVWEVMRIRVAAVALQAPGAGNGMCINITLNSGKPAGNEAYNAEAVTAPNKVTTEDAFAINDAIEWVVTDADDADLDDIGNGETAECLVVYNAAVAADIATNALIRTVVAEYV